MSTPSFASTGDLTEKKVSFTEVGPNLYAYTAEGDPNTGVIIGDDSVMIIDAQATPAMAQRVIEKIRSVTDKPIKYVVLSHYHAVRVLGASAYGASEIVASEKCRGMIQERGNEDWASELGRFPRLFQAAESVPGLTWPTMTFNGKMTVYLGKRRVELLQLGRAHTAGDIVAWVPDAGVMFTGDIVEYHSACYCGDAHYNDWPATLDAIARYNPKSIAPGRGDALVGAEMVQAGLDATKDFVTSTYNAVAEVAARGGSLKDAMTACRAACDHKFGNYAIYEHCLPFNVARAYDEALGIENPRIWTAERDRDMWAALQG
ncbi:MBL fold metallo-hydrolase [Acidocella aminolytica]|jgi:glyoxylase-like metal-dependent hydrolase (beta-lactamase superfamily II)|uniref:Metallo-beta-lactamase n=1 Tax=Acidocella aminolytica 101 = DSM 11237 TaxID=1120923 RepID=A0A0D6PHQ5_9PROT|nr:MBL fold metallo-hydrolase [Acidocella aminolytica]GAN80911.1 metallo-beta-lactamase [Acidocella aminolytica 101 = DSM 11237]GBQ35450.1 Zn-dependent hydrolase [Acidocella aminolytica 101 = DSM 11237]SHF40598.1 Glyoxylase, beta-lactamase superfamily II [Acidocella aminolytica 101 = DSM 11237]